jgi:hypothetical protein
MMIRDNPSKELQKRLYILFAWFILCIVTGMLMIKIPQMLGLELVFISFLIFNVFTTLYNLIMFTTKRLIQEEEKLVKCPSRKH